MQISISNRKVSWFIIDRDIGLYQIKFENKARSNRNAETKDLTNNDNYLHNVKKKS